LFGTTEGGLLDPNDPLVAGHVHDGVRDDGHAQKVNLEDHVTGQLDGTNIQDSSITQAKLAFSISGVIDDERVRLRLQALSVTATSNLLTPTSGTGITISNPNAGTNSQVAYFKARVTAYAEPAGAPPAADDTACWTIEGVVQRDQSTDTLTLPVSPVVTPFYNANGTDWDVRAVVDDTSKELRIQGTVDGFTLGPGAAPDASFFADIDLSPAGTPL
jgi:hypothetical protein